MGKITWHHYDRLLQIPPESAGQWWVDLREEECFWIQRDPKAAAYAAAITAAATAVNPVFGAIVGAEVLSLKQAISEKHHGDGVRVVITQWEVPPKGIDRDVQSGHGDVDGGRVTLGPVNFELD